MFRITKIMIKPHAHVQHIHDINKIALELEKYHKRNMDNIEINDYKSKIAFNEMYATLNSKLQQMDKKFETLEFEINELKRLVLNTIRRKL